MRPRSAAGRHAWYPAMIRRLPVWLRSLLIIAVGVVFLGATAVIVYAVQTSQSGQTRAGDHNWRDVQAEGNALCQSCHFLEHNAHGPNTTCLDCHAPDPGDHAARVVTCTTCHGMGGGGMGGFTTQESPLPDPTTTAPTTTSSTTSTTAAPTTTTSSTTSTTAAPTTTSSSSTTTTAAP